MSILFVHGVATRDAHMSPEVEALLRRHVAPVISDAPDRVPIDYVYWGDIAARFAWGGASRPRTPIAGMGGAGMPPSEVLKLVASERELLDHLPAGPGSPAPAGGLAPAGPGAGTSGAAPGPGGPSRLHDLSPDDLADVLADLYLSLGGDGDVASTILVLDEVAHDPGVRQALSEAADLDDEVEVLRQTLRGRLEEESGMAGMGFGDWFGGLGSRLKEALGRGRALPGFVLGRAVAEFRKPLNEFVSVFLGDVFEYLKERGTPDAPGAIPRRLLEPLHAALERKESTGEPVILLSHSMGGQIVYDVLTCFLPESSPGPGPAVDFWCATASQVALFEELKLFARARDDLRAPSRVPRPATLGYWWNVWDHNDFISFTGERIFEGIDDEEFNSGMGLVQAHGGYLQRPSFFRRLAGKVTRALEEGS